jgi:hypothetical protein
MRAVSAPEKKADSTRKTMRTERNRARVGKV